MEQQVWSQLRYDSSLFPRDLDRIAVRKLDENYILVLVDGVTCLARRTCRPEFAHSGSRRRFQKSIVKGFVWKFFDTFIHSESCVERNGGMRIISAEQLEERLTHVLRVFT